MLTGAVANLLLNALIIILLTITIGYCWVLNRRIKILQDSRGELALLLKHFDESTNRASESIIALQTASKKIGENIQFKIEKANFLIDDLTFMIEKAEKLANKMEASFAVNRARNRVITEQPVEKVEQPSRIELPVEVNDSAAIQPVLRERADKPAINREKTVASLEAVLERVVGRGKSQEVEMPAPKPERTGAMRVRSRSEQELLDMIKTGIKG